MCDFIRLNGQQAVQVEMIATLAEAVSQTSHARVLAKLKHCLSVTVHSPHPLAGEGLGVRAVDSTTDPVTPTLFPISAADYPQIPTHC